MAVYDMFRDPGIAPRVGDEHQVEIPVLMSDSEYESYVKNPLELELDSNLVPYDFIVGLPVPVMWIDKNAKHGDLAESLDNGGGLVPGESNETWTDEEVDSFVLGLYLFGKNLKQVRRIMENKTMSSVLSFYYGKFYRSDEYERWSPGRKTRSRKVVHGHRIFSGARQKELLFRLSSKISVEVQTTLSQVSGSYCDGKISMEEYVGILKAMVGLKNLVEAVGIGKGQHDLTRTQLDLSKWNNSKAVPVGKACSSLGPSEIVDFLTGDYRFSKAQTDDLFWEAVWPRLLARGWHSERPKDYNYAASTTNKVLFLFPGVGNFNRRRLKKEEHFLDSVKDVLNKVALDPSLIKLDDEEPKDVKLQQQQHCYPQPGEQTTGNSIISARHEKNKETSGKISDETILKPEQSNSNQPVFLDSSIAGMNSDKEPEPSPQTVPDLGIPQPLHQQQPVDGKDTKDVIVSNITEDTNPRRLSTRNRPPTMRALEAHASGYLKIGNKAATSRPKITPCSTTTNPTPSGKDSKTSSPSKATDN